MKNVLTEEQGQELVKLARNTIARQLSLGRESQEVKGVAGIECGTFVTLKKGGILRGCIGNLLASGSVSESVKRNAISAAFHDARFPPLNADELSEIDIDISVLSPPVPLEYADGEDLVSRLRPGIDGVILRSGGAGATFLPQVWEQLPIPEMFLAHLCRKAGLHDTAWRDIHPHIEIYQVQCFEEEKG